MPDEVSQVKVDDDKVFASARAAGEQASRRHSMSRVDGAQAEQADATERAVQVAARGATKRTELHAEDLLVELERDLGVLDAEHGVVCEMVPSASSCRVRCRAAPGSSAERASVIVEMTGAGR